MTARTRSPTRCAGPGSGRSSRSGSGAGGLRTRRWRFWDPQGRCRLRPAPGSTHPRADRGHPRGCEHRACDRLRLPGLAARGWPMPSPLDGRPPRRPGSSTAIGRGGRIVRFVPRASGATASKAARARASDRLSGRRRGLRYLHIGEFGPPQGRGCPTPEPRQSPDLSDAIPVPARRLQGRPVDRTAALRRQPGPDPLSLFTGGTLVTARSPEELAESPWYPRLTAITGASVLDRRDRAATWVPRLGSRRRPGGRARPCRVARPRREVPHDRASRHGLRDDGMRLLFDGGRTP